MERGVFMLSLAPCIYHDPRAHKNIHPMHAGSACKLVRSWFLSAPELRRGQVQVLNRNVSVDRCPSIACETQFMGAHRNALEENAVVFAAAAESRGTCCCPGNA